LYKWIRQGFRKIPMRAWQPIYSGFILFIRGAFRVLFIQGGGVAGHFLGPMPAPLCLFGRCLCTRAPRSTLLGPGLPPRCVPSSPPVLPPLLPGPGFTFLLLFPHAFLVAGAPTRVFFLGPLFPYSPYDVPGATLPGPFSCSRFLLPSYGRLSPLPHRPTPPGRGPPLPLFPRDRPPPLLGSWLLTPFQIFTACRGFLAGFPTTFFHPFFILQVPGPFALSGPPLASTLDCSSCPSPSGGRPFQAGPFLLAPSLVFRVAPGLYLPGSSPPSPSVLLGGTHLLSTPLSSRVVFNPPRSLPGFLCFRGYSLGCLLFCCRLPCGHPGSHAPSLAPGSRGGW